MRCGVGNGAQSHLPHGNLVVKQGQRLLVREARLDQPLHRDAAIVFQERAAHNDTEGAAAELLGRDVVELFALRAVPCNKLPIRKNIRVSPVKES